MCIMKGRREYRNNKNENNNMSNTNEKAATPATPAKLRDGTWGAVTKLAVVVGDTVQITTRAGKTWAAKVTAVHGATVHGTTVSTQSSDRAPGTTAPARRAYHADRVDCRRFGWDGVVGSRSYYSSGQYDEDS